MWARIAPTVSGDPSSWMSVSHGQPDGVVCPGGEPSAPERLSLTATDAGF